MVTDPITERVKKNTQDFSDINYRGIQRKVVEMEQKRNDQDQDTITGNGQQRDSYTKWKTKDTDLWKEAPLAVRKAEVSQASSASFVLSPDKLSRTAQPSCDRPLLSSQVTDKCENISWLLAFF